MFTKRRGNRSTALSFILITVAAACFLIFIFSQQSAPTPSPAAGKPAEKAETAIASSAPILPFSMPTSISIPSIDVQSTLITVGKNPDGTIEVPGADNYNKAAWYRNSPAPGQLGSSIIEGHVDYIDKGPAIFFRLGNLKLDDKITVERQDGISAIFKVDELAVYQKDEFPTEKVYAINDRPALILITCGGQFNGTIGEYDSNVVVYASLVKPS